MDYNLTAKDTAFFDLTEPLGWGTKTTDYKDLNLQLFRLDRGGVASRLRAFDKPINTRWLKEHLGSLTDLLHTAAVRDLGEDPCCDSWSDTLAHIVGLGRHEFQRCMYEPQKIVDRAEAGDYKESFSYALPYDVEYDKCYQWKHEHEAAKYLGMLTARILLEGWDDNTPEEVEALLAIQYSLSLMTVGKVKEYLDTREVVLALMKNQDTRVLIDLGWGPDNLYSDVEMYKEFFGD